MKVMCEFGIKRDGFIGARVSLKDNGKWKTVRGKKICERWADIMRTALGSRLTDEDFRTEFSFYLEPHTLTGPLDECRGTMWADFKRKNSCCQAVADVGLSVYKTIVAAVTVEGED